MKKTIFILIAAITTSLAFAQGSLKALKTDRESIADLLDNWHAAAAKSDFDNYFSAIADDGVFIGTDASEYWTKGQFQEYAKPYFDKVRGWKFTPLQRNIYVKDRENIAWFDELLDGDMKLCRGSGVLRKGSDGKWKIVQYVLSMTIPNEKAEEITKRKSDLDEIYTEQLKAKKK